MRVSPKEPFQVVYALYNHQYLGYLFESFIVQKDEHNRLMLRYQNISEKNVGEFAKNLTKKDFELVRLMDSIQQDVIIRKFHKTKIRPIEFFPKVYDEKTGDKELKDKIYHYLESKRSQILSKLKNRLLFEMGSDGAPDYHKRIHIENHEATVLFHFFRNADNTNYYPTIRHRDKKIEFRQQGAILLCNEPAWLMLNDHVYHFKQAIDGVKLKPFLRKKFILVPKKVEKTYYEKFVTQIVAAYKVHAQGFEIKEEKYLPKAILTISELNDVNPAYKNIDPETYSQIHFKLIFEYNKFRFPFDEKRLLARVELEEKDDSYLFHKILRDGDFEEEKLNLLYELNLELKNGIVILGKHEAFSWINKHGEILKENGIELTQTHENIKKRYFIGTSRINLELKESKDWFDIYAKVFFGDYEISFIKLRKWILSGKREFILPNGETAVIPEEWFTQYSELFDFMDTHEGQSVLKKHHLLLVNNLNKDNLAKVMMSNKLKKLQDFEHIEDYPLPQNFKGKLRPYQKAGYNWMRFLQEYHFGGCLADDMGLGKTIQTLSILQQQKELAGIHQANLLIMPTSLLYNWEMEAKKFTPDIKVLVYTTTERNKNINEYFSDYDVILTSYGIARIDIDILKTYHFNYIILDESQAIKNPTSHISRAVRQLKSAFRLILTGTPIENTTLDLWSQLSFVNTGLLGSQSFFKNEYQYPIEKKHDIAKTKRLHSIIKPFILRRTKSQVAKELPEKIENIHLSIMTEEQERVYEEEKSYYRNQILEHIETKGIAKSQIILLQGLVKLRQIANHPLMVNEEYDGDSGKLRDVKHRLVSALSKNHKILVFSQFVKHLTIIRKMLDELDIPYAYLDGSTKNRRAEVDKFQNNEEIKVFLLSIKTGGVGLNLTAADYVFILDPWWNPAVEMQAVDRAHRIGQENKVFIYKFISKNTIEEKILALQKEKTRLVTDLITTEASFFKNLSRADIDELLG